MRTVMWEAKAVDGRAEELLAHALAHAPEQAKIYRGGDGRVVVIDPTGAGLPDPPAGVLTRAPHAWPFEPVPRGLAAGPDSQHSA